MGSPIGTGLDNINMNEGNDALRGTYRRLAVIGLLPELGSDMERHNFLDKF